MKKYKLTEAEMIEHYIVRRKLMEYSAIGTVEEFKVLKLKERKNVGWISCKERLPNKEEYLKDDGRFIVTDGNRCYQSVFDIYSQKFRTSVFTAFGSYKYEEDKCVIAWQPLPEPYREQVTE